MFFIANKLPCEPREGRISCARYALVLGPAVFTEAVSPSFVSENFLSLAHYTCFEDLGRMTVSP